MRGKSTVRTQRRVVLLLIVALAIVLIVARPWQSWGAREAEALKRIQIELELSKKSQEELRAKVQELSAVVAEKTKRIESAESAAETQAKQLREEARNLQEQVNKNAAAAAACGTALAKTQNTAQCEVSWNLRSKHEKASKLFPSVTSNYLAVDCSDPLYCYRPQCYAKEDDRCEPNPWFLPHGVNATRMTICEGQPPANELPALIPNPEKGSPPLRQADVLRNFKHLTGLHTRKQWYRWGGSCSSENSGADDDGSMSGHHEISDDGKTNLYWLKNFCLRPYGKIAGYRPKVNSFDGMDEVYPITFENYSKPFYEYLDNIEVLSERPKCFLDTKLVIQPVTLRADNAGHAYMRMASLLDVRKRAYPQATKAETTTAFVLVSETEHKYRDWVDDHPSDLTDLASTGFIDFLTIVTGSHFVVAGTDADRIQLRKVFGISLQDPRVSELVCFKHAAVQYTVTVEEGKQLRTGPTKRPVAPLFYLRHREPLEAFNEEMRLCAGVHSRRPEVRQRPKILFAIRTQKRRFSLNPRIIYELGQYVESQGAEFIVHDIRHGTLLDFVRVYSEVDAVLGPYGLGLLFGMFMPPGGVIGEVNFAPKRCSAQTGINLEGNRQCDYGGLTWVNGLHHVVISIENEYPCHIRHRMGHAYGEWHLNPAYVLQLAKAVVCTLKARVPVTIPSDPTAAIGVGAVPAQCNDPLQGLAPLQGACAEPAFELQYKKLLTFLETQANVDLNEWDAGDLLLRDRVFHPT